MKIYVGNLAYRTTEDGIRSAFEPYGTVNSVDIIIDRQTNQSKGFGFVEMPNDDEAQRAIEGLDNTQLDDRTVKVNEARAREPRPSGGHRPRYNDRGDRGSRSY